MSLKNGSYSVYRLRNTLSTTFSKTKEAKPKKRLKEHRQISPFKSEFETGA